MIDDPKNAPIFKSSHIVLSEFTGAQKFCEIGKKTIFLLSYQVNEAFCVPDEKLREV